MKRSTVLKALTMMDQKRVNEFIDKDCRSIDEIVDAVADELEKDYVYFMYELFGVIEKLEKEEQSGSLSKLLSSMKSDDLQLVKHKELILSDEDSKRFHELIKNMPPINIIPKINIPDYKVIKRGE